MNLKDRIRLKVSKDTLLKITMLVASFVLTILLTSVVAPPIPGPPGGG